MTKKPPPSFESAQLKFLESTCCSTPTFSSWGEGDADFKVASFDDYPVAGARTHVTFGVSRLPFSSYRGLDMGFELVLSAPADQAAPLLETLATAIVENVRRARTRERRPFIEANGIFAPGYPPHFVFTSHVSATPAITAIKEQHRFGDRYVVFLSAIPIDDTELRAYEKSVPQFLQQLRADGLVGSYPRPR
jgi:hypothetical protein